MVPRKSLRTLLRLASLLFLLGECLWAESPSVSYRTTSDWGFGIVGEFTLTNPSPRTMQGWTLEFDLPGNITNFWGGRVESSGEGRFTIRPETWNEKLLPGARMVIGFQAAPGGGGPSDIRLYPILSGATDLPVATAALPKMEDGHLRTVYASHPLKLTWTVDEISGGASRVSIFLTNTGWKRVRDWSLLFTLQGAISDLSGGLLASAGPGLWRLQGTAFPNTTDLPPGATVQISFDTQRLPMASFPERVVLSTMVAPRTGDKFPYGLALRESLFFYEAQRSGKLPASNRIPWRGDSALEDGKDQGIDLTGGYYDAGDHIKFAFPMASAMTLLIWGGIEYPKGYARSGEWNQFLETVRWGTDWLMKAHTARNELFVQVGEPTTDHRYWGPPEAMTMNRRSFKIDEENPGSEVAAEAAAALAAASILFGGADPAYAAKCLSHARELYEFAETYRGTYSDSVKAAASHYPSRNGYEDELAWAATWLYAATSEPLYLQKAENIYVRNIQGRVGGGTLTWDDKRPGVALLLARLTKGEAYKSDVRNFLEKWVYGGGGLLETPGGLVWLNEWGSLRYAANTAFLAFVYADTFGDPSGAFESFGRKQIDYMLGDNPAGRSYLIGFGANFPRNPHHRGSHGSTLFSIDEPEFNTHVLRGALVGGPSAPDDFAFSDDRRDIRTNEVALDYNAGFTGALARLVPGAVQRKSIPLVPPPRSDRVR